MDHDIFGFGASHDTRRWLLLLWSSEEKVSLVDDLPVFDVCRRYQL